MGQPKYKNYPSEASENISSSSENHAQTKSKVLELRDQIHKDLQNPKNLAKAIEILLNWSKNK